MLDQLSDLTHLKKKKMLNGRVDLYKALNL